MGKKIEFRAWDKKKQMWTNWKCYDNMFYFMDKNTGVWIRDDKFKRFILLQYTGLKDIKEVKICEGDIVQDADRRLFEVKHGAYTRVDYIGMDKRIRSGGYGWYVQNLYTKQMVQGSEMIYTEVIGNIYENPELSGVGQ